ncbi:MAG: hypothetical protein QW761_00120 [Candidatus Aenigmatarchaeota archaeon]
MAAYQRYKNSVRLHNTFEDYKVPVEQRKWLMNRVRKLREAGYPTDELRKVIINEVQRKGVDWEKLLTLLLELAKVIIPLIISLL